MSSIVRTVAKRIVVQKITKKKLYYRLTSG